MNVMNVMNVVLFCDGCRRTVTEPLDEVNRHYTNFTHPNLCRFCVRKEAAKLVGE